MTFLPMPESHKESVAALLLASAFVDLGIFFFYGLYKFIGAERDTAVNTLGFTFSVAGFTVLLAATVVRLAIREGTSEVTRLLDGVTADAVNRALLLVILGLDVAWEILIGTALFFIGLALRQRTGLGPAWGYLAVVIAIVLVAVNAATFPRPPENWGLVDVGPLVAVFFLALGARLFSLGRRSSL
jgi:hypothetical protein